MQVQKDSVGGKKLQTYKNTVSTNEVHSEAVTLTDSSGNALTVISGDKSLYVMAKDYQTGIAEGDITNHTAYVKLGNVTSVVNVEQDVWTQGGKYVFPDSAMQMEVVSTSANDTSNGTGIRTVKIGYLDASYVSKSETVTLNGVNAVNTVATDIYRVNSIRAVTTGTGGVAAGTIYVRNLNHTTIYRAIQTGFTRGRSLIYTVPASTTMYITQINLSSVATAAGHYTTFTGRVNFDDITGAKTAFMEPFFEITLQDQAQPFPLKEPIKIPATCDVVMSVKADANNSNTVCFASWRGWTET